MAAQVFTFIDIFKALLLIAPRIPYLIKSYIKLLALNEENHKSWGTLLEKNAEKYPKRPALKWDEATMTYSELNERTNRFAHYFISKGLKKGEVVSVYLQNRPELFIIYSAIAKIGAVASTINTNQRGQSLLHSMNHIPSKMYIIGEEVIESFQEIRAAVRTARENNLFFVADKRQSAVPKGFIDVKTEVMDMPASSPSTLKEVRLKDSFAYVFTSGTTGGVPKAAIITHKRLLSSVIWYGKILQRTKPTDTVYCPLPFFHTNGLCVGWPAAAVNGAALAIRRKFSVAHFWDDVRKFNATSLIYVGELLRYLLNLPENPHDRKHPLNRIIGNGLSLEAWKDFKRRFGIKKIYEFYGAAESMGAFRNILNLDYTVGLCLQPHAFIRCDVNDGLPERGKDGFMQGVNVGESGLLIFKITKRNKFIGYVDSKATEEKILRDVFKRGDAWFNTGDLMRNMGWGQAQFVDRLGDSFRWKGENVSTTEVENVINGFPAITLAAVYGVKIPATEGRASMAAILASKRFSGVDFRALHYHLREALPSYAIPFFLRFTECLDFTSTEKVKKRHLRDEGFDLHKVKDPIYVLLPGKAEYEPLSEEIFANIQNCKYKF